MAKLEDNKSVRCSFCGKPQEMVKKIIACADIHFKNLQGIDELKEVLKGFLQQ